MLALTQLLGVVGGEDLRDLGAAGEGAWKGVDALGAQPLDLGPPLARRRARRRLDPRRRLAHGARPTVTRSPPCSRGGCPPRAASPASPGRGGCRARAPSASRAGVSSIRPRITPRPSSPQVAGDRDPRLAADLGRALEDRRVGDVGKVGEDQVDLLAERVGQALGDDHLELEAEPLGVLAGRFGRLGREVGGAHPQVRAAR